MSKTYDYSDYLAELEAHGDKIALIDAGNDDRLSYRQLVDLGQAIARQLKGLEIKTGERLMLIGLRGLDWVPVFFGAQLAGLVVVPIDTRASDDLVQAMIEATRPALIVKGAGLKLTTKAKMITATQLLKQAGNLKGKQSVTASKPSVLGQILLSSGTWARPKGVSLTQANLLQNTLAAWQVYSLERQEILLSILPLSHAYEQMCGLHIPLRAGCTIVYLDAIEANKIKAAIKKYQVSLIVAVPRILELFKAGILRQVPAAKRDRVVGLANKLRLAPVPVRRRLFRKVHQGLGPSLRTLVVGGAPLSSETDNFFQGLGYKILVGYGLSETSPIISILVRQRGRRLGDVGQVLSNIETKVSPDGELLVRGPTVFAGYWPEKRQARSWFNTGDLVDIDRGSIRLRGRSKDLIVFASGDKVLAGEVEDLIGRHLPQIEEAVVMSSPDKTGASQGLYIAYRATKPVRQDKFEQLFRDHLPKSARIVGVNNIYPEFLSRTHTLKLARKDNHDRFLVRPV